MAVLQQPRADEDRCGQRGRGVYGKRLARDRWCWNRLLQGPAQMHGLVPVHSCPTCGARPSENGAKGHSALLRCTPPHLSRCPHADLKGPRESAVRGSAEVDDPGVLSAADEVIVLRLQKEDLIGQVRSPCAMT